MTIWDSKMIAQTFGDGSASSLSEFVEWSRNSSRRFGLRSATLNVWFRGQSDVGWPLKPSLYRGTFHPELEREMLRDFRSHAAEYVDLQHKTDIDWLFLAQHHGIPTRIIDWTENPLVGLYFACSAEHQAIDGVVWALNAWELNKTANSVQAVPGTDEHYVSDYTINISSEFGTINRDVTAVCPIAVRPSYRFRRQNAQSGVFTIHGKEKKAIESISFVRKNRSACLIKCIVPAAAKARLLRELYAVGIHKGFLFPSIDGVAESIKYRYSSEYLQW